MKRIILLTVALLGASYLMRTSADTPEPPRPPTPPAVRHATLDGDGSCCETGRLSRAALLAGGQATAASHDACDVPVPDEAACPSAAEPAEPSDFPDTEKPLVPPATTRGIAYVVSDLMALPERAEGDAYAKLRRALMAWMVPDAPATWQPPAELVRSVVVAERHRAIDRDYGTLQQVALKVDLSPKHRAEFQRAYLRDEGMQRMGWLGAVVTFVLVVLAILAGYIRTDEATKGYYTARLRMLAAAGVGAAGVVLYQVLT